MVPRTRFPFQPLAIRGLRGRGRRGALEFIWQLPVAVLQSWRIIGRFRPLVVLGLGGYGSVPMVLAAWLRRVPSVLMEQNAHPGMANRVLVHLARRVCTTFADSARFFPAGKTVHTGNPVRQLDASKKISPDHFTLFVFGGSQGARAINRAVVDAAMVLKARLPRMQLMHQTGPSDLEWVQRRYAENGVDAEVCAFVHDMGDAYGRADLVVCRAGAIDARRTHGARQAGHLDSLSVRRGRSSTCQRRDPRAPGAAEMVLDAQLTGALLAERVAALAEDRARLQAMGTAAAALAVPDAALRVEAVCRQVVAGEG